MPRYRKCRTHAVCMPLLALAASACGDDSVTDFEDTTTDAGSEGPVEIEVEATFVSLYEEVLLPRCASCHGGSQEQGGFAFGSSQETAYAAFVADTNDNPAASCAIGTSAPYVTPGDASASSLISLIDDDAENNCEGVDSMPRGGRLDTGIVAAFREWIDAGASP